MDSNFIFELQALIQKMNQSEAIKSMDPVVRYALYLELEKANPKLIKEFTEILNEESNGYQKVEEKFAKQVDKLLINYKHDLDNAEYEVKKKKMQKATKAEQKKAEQILKSIK